MAESLEIVVARMDERQKAMDLKQDAHNDATQKVLEPLVSGYNELKLELSKVQTNWFWTSTISAFISTSIVLLASQWLHPSLAAVPEKNEPTTKTSVDTDVSRRDVVVYSTDL